MAEVKKHKVLPVPVGDSNKIFYLFYKFSNILVISSY
jgi:hypothetical protein